MVGEGEMKRRSLPFVIFVVLAAFCSARGNDQTGKFAIGVQAGFSVGFGSAFSEQYIYWDDYNAKARVKNELRHEWGVKVKYGLKPNWALAGIYEYQAAKSSVFLANGGGFWQNHVLKSFNCAAVNIIYIRFPERITSTYYTSGVGWYMIDQGKDKPGMNIGAGAESSLSNHLGSEAGLRFHKKMTEPRIATYINALIGLNCYF